MAEANKKENIFVRAGKRVSRWFREMKSELKKVVWSTPKQVLKNTLIVVACVLVVGAFVWLFDLVAQTLITALIGGVQSLFK